MHDRHLYVIQALFVLFTAFGSGIISLEDKLQWLNVCRYTIYILTIHGITASCSLVQAYVTTRDLGIEVSRTNIVLYASCAALLVHYGRNLYEGDFVYLFLASIAVRLPEMASKSISYGTGMACSFFEGYLVHVLPSDGAGFVGFEENIRALEDREGVLFPVKKLFIVITKSLFCPPDLKHFNKGTDVPHMEAFNSLEDVTKCVAGVRNRVYRNTAYKIYRARVPGVGPVRPVCLAAECATPLHTLHKVANNRTVYQHLADMDIKSIVEDFCSTLKTIVARSPDCRGKCELVYYDDEDPSQNLAQILLDKIKEIEPKFEEKIIQRSNDNIIED